MIEWTLMDIGTYIGMTVFNFMAGSILVSVSAFIISAISESSLKALLYWLLLLNFMVGVMAFFPTHDRMYQLKISKIKNEAINQENISKGVDAIERVSRKLECKYLGCDED